MFLFLIPLLLGFFFNSVSAFTTFYSQRLGERGGKLLTIILRDVVGIPVLTIGYAMAALATSSMFFNPVFFSSTLGWLLVLVGGVTILTGLVSLKWRSVAPTERDTLVLHGIYTHIRHPIYSGMIMELAGLFLWRPSLTVLVACVLGVIWLIVQARLEEMDLLQRLPAYAEYMQRVPRFVPRFKLR
jgi:protein-S-isoprenylcysteine O-methyltransferase Ste14